MWRRHVTSNSNAIATTSNFLALSGKIDTKSSNRSVPTQRELHRAQIFCCSKRSNEPSHSPLLARAGKRTFLRLTTTMGSTLATIDKKGPTSFEIGPFEFKSGSVLLFHTATV